MRLLKDVKRMNAIFNCLRKLFGFPSPETSAIRQLERETINTVAADDDFEIVALRLPGNNCLLCKCASDAAFDCR